MAQFQLLFVSPPSSSSITLTSANIDPTQPPIILRAPPSIAEVRNRHRQGSNNRMQLLKEARARQHREDLRKARRDVSIEKREEAAKLELTIPSYHRFPLLCRHY